MSDDNAAATGFVSDDGATLMGIVNVNTDSFSDPRDGAEPDERLTAARTAVTAGAAIVDLGAQSAALRAEVVDPDDQILALVPLVEALSRDGIPVSVDTYEPEVAVAVMDAGAVLLNDFSGRVDPAIIAAVASNGGRYVLTHNPLGPRVRQDDPDYYGDVVDDVARWFEERLNDIEAAGLAADQAILDPGVDVSKTPRQSLDLLRGADRLRDRFDQPLLWAISRKDVLGALTGRRPSGRDAATLAVLDAVADHPRTVVRLHDVAGANDYLTVRAALRGKRDLDPAARLPEDLRREG